MTEDRKPGRPAVDPAERLSGLLRLRLPVWQDVYLRVLSERWGCSSTGEVVRRIVSEHLETEAGDGAASVREFLTRQGLGELDRLSDALRSGELDIDDVERILGENWHEVLGWKRVERRRD